MNPSHAPDTTVPPTHTGTGSGLRRWQREALAKYHETSPTDFLVTATPGSGKTTFGLTLAAQLKERRAIRRIIVVAPTDHLRTQWADAAARFGLVLDPNLPNSVGPVRDGTDGYVTTYAQVAARPMLHRRRVETGNALALIDEIHHAGDSLSWGEAIYEAFEPARRRVAMTGTPFRTDPSERIPFVRYTDVGPGEVVSEADYAYGYGDALNDGVVRPVVFAAYSGTSRWMNSAGDVLAAELGADNTRSIEELAWRTALDPGGNWVPHVIAAVDDRVTHLREQGIHDAAGLILASDQEAARAYADIAKKITGKAPVLILSDDPKASKKIHAFGESDDRLAVCVRMVSEGVDIPRASVLGYLTSYRTPLFFAQAVGRVVRARSPQESATVFLPAVRPLLTLAAELEEQRNHVVRMTTWGDDLDGLERENRVLTEPGASEFVALDAEAKFAHVLHRGKAFLAEPAPPSEDDSDFLGLPGLLTPEQTAALLAKRDEDVRRRSNVRRNEDPADQLAVGAAQADWRGDAELRREVNTLVAQVAARTGRRHAEVHVELRTAIPGPPSATASRDVLAGRRDWLLARTI
jgi:superfamily II DNA or RNA helicase